MPLCHIYFACIMVIVSAGQAVSSLQGETILFLLNTLFLLL